MSDISLNGEVTLPVKIVCKFVEFLSLANKSVAAPALSAASLSTKPYTLHPKP